MLTTQILSITDDYQIKNITNNTNKKGNNYISRNDSKVTTKGKEKENNDKYQKHFKLEERDISYEEQKHIKDIFRKLFLFDSLPNSVLEQIMSSLFLIKIEAGDYLYIKGDQTTSFYIVLEGELEAINKDNKEKDAKVIKYFPWDSFGISTLMAKNHFHIVDTSVKCNITSKLFVLNGETFISIQQKLVNCRLEERFNFLNTIIFFKSLDCNQKYILAKRMEMIVFLPGTEVITRGKVDKTIYLIKSGKVNCSINGNKLKELSVSDYFGLVSIFKNNSSDNDVITIEKTICFTLKENDLRDSIGNNFIEVILMEIFSQSLINNTAISEYINVKNLKNIFPQFHINNYKKNEKINEGKIDFKRIILVLEGNFVNEQNGKIEYHSGDIIGGEALTNDLDIPSNLKAFPDCLTLEANLSDISSFLGGEFRATTMNLLNRVQKMRKIPIFNLASENTLKLIADGIKKERFSPGKIIMTEDTQAEKFYIILKGTVRISKMEKLIRELDKDSCFGEKDLLSQEQITTYTIKAVNNVTCYSMNKNKFSILLKEKRAFDYIQNCLALQNDTLQLKDLKLVQHLGNGKYGIVNLVRDDKFNLYAIKAINRWNANLSKRIAYYLIWERRIMLSIDHPFIIKMVKSFKNDDYVFFLMEYINGITLKNLILSNLKTFTTSDIKFYIGSLVLVINYMHRKGIIHRDIKPSNVLIDKYGYIKLVDFGTSKFLKNFTNTIIGTPHYMAPEILEGKGYSLSVDYWSIGISAFEMFYHKFPFGSTAGEIMDVYNEIVYSSFSIPKEDNVNRPINELLEGLLSKQVDKRICSFDKIKKLELFKGFDWNGLLKKNIVTPFSPKIIEMRKSEIRNYNLVFEKEMMKFRINMIINHQEQWDSKWADEF